MMAAAMTISTDPPGASAGLRFRLPNAAWRATRIREIGADRHGTRLFRRFSRAGTFRSGIRHGLRRCSLLPFSDSTDHARSSVPCLSLPTTRPRRLIATSRAGEVLVARRKAEVVGHVQVIRYGVQWEIKSIAVAGQEQHRGIGTALVRSVLQRAVLEGCIRVVVGTATADIDNLRFYQRLGFRMDCIEWDAFSRDRSYTHLDVDGIRSGTGCGFRFDVSSG